MVNSGVAAIARSTVSSKPFETNPALSSQPISFQLEAKSRQLKAAFAGL